MVCRPTETASPDTLDVPALKAKYIEERRRRLRPDGEAQYVRPSGELASIHHIDPHMPVVQRDPIGDEIDVAILGAGWGGILAAYHLMQAGVTSLRNIDHAGDFGGVWYWNRYPGIQCDNDSYCYLPLLEETGYMPSRKFCDGWEIQGYSRLIAERFGFYDKALFHTLVTGLRWDAEIRRWQVSTDRGDRIRARFVVMAGGVLNMPKLPGVPGIELFEGAMFHTARWDYAYTGGEWKKPTLDKLRDKRVAIVGTGASAIQAVPHLAKYAQQLYVVQRTPSSVDERPNPTTDPAWATSLQPGWQQERKAVARSCTIGPGEPDVICDIWTVNNAFSLPEDLTDPRPFWEKPLSNWEMVDVGVRSNWPLLNTRKPFTP